MRHDQGSYDGHRRRRGGHGQDDDVGAHVEHRDPRHEDPGQRRKHGEKSQADQSGVDASQEPDPERGGEPSRERRSGHDGGEPDHGENL